MLSFKLIFIFTQFTNDIYATDGYPYQFAVEPRRGPECAVRGVADRLAVAAVVVLGALELEGRPLVVGRRVVLASSDDPEGSGRPGMQNELQRQSDFSATCHGYSLSIY